MARGGRATLRPAGPLTGVLLPRQHVAGGAEFDPIQIPQPTRYKEPTMFQADQTEHRICPRDLGRWLVIQQIDPHLQAEGHYVIAAQHGLDTLTGDVAAVKSIGEFVLGGPSERFG